MHHTVDLDAGGHTGQRGKKHTTQAVAQRGAEAALQRLDDELTVAAIRRKVAVSILGRSISIIKTLLVSRRPIAAQVRSK